MRTQDYFFPYENRYVLDFGPCSSKEGYAQVDTGQDASYYGIWANPSLRRIVTFAEGDLKVQDAETDEEFVDAIRKIEKFHRQADEFRGIDPGWEPEPLASQFRKLGLGDLLY